MSIVTADSVARCATLRLQHIKDKRDGAITVAQAGGPIPFEFKRVYYISGINDPATVRGGHAHKTLQQALFCANGSFNLELDDGEHQITVEVDTPDTGVYIGPFVWHTLTNFALAAWWSSSPRTST
jgi:hypothetical protein